MEVTNKILQFGVNEMNYVIPNNIYGCDLHNQIYNSVFFIETTEEAESVLNKYGIEKAILEVKNYEIDMFGIQKTYKGMNRRTCNMLIYIQGEKFLSNCETLFLNWDNLLTAENIEKIKKELKKQFKK